MTNDTATDRRLPILLAMAMFVLVVDTSLMNVSISAVVDDLGHDRQRRPVGDRARGAGLGRVHPHRQQDRRPHRAQAGLRPRAARPTRSARWRWRSPRASPRSSSSGRSSAGSARRCCCPRCSRSSTATSRARPRSGPTRWSAPPRPSPPPSGRCSAASSPRSCRGASAFLLEVVVIAIVLSGIGLVRDVPYTGSRDVDVVGRRPVRPRHGRTRARHPGLAGGRRGGRRCCSRSAPSRSRLLAWWLRAAQARRASRP